MEILADAILEIVRTRVSVVDLVWNVWLSIFCGLTGSIFYWALWILRDKNMTHQTYKHREFPWQEFLAAVLLSLVLGPTGAVLLKLLFPELGLTAYVAAVFLLSSCLYKIDNLNPVNIVKFLVNVWVSLIRREKLEDKDLVVGVEDVHSDTHCTPSDCDECLNYEHCDKEHKVTRRDKDDGGDKDAGENEQNT